MRPWLHFALVTLAALGSAGLTARLGLWQLDRASEKLALQASVDARLHMPPLDASALAATVQEVARTSEELSRVAETLRSTVRRFKLR